MRQPGIVALHAVTTTNALHYAFTHSGDDATRRLLLLQNAAFLPMFREAMSGRGKLADRRLDRLSAAEPRGRRPDADAILAEVSGNPLAAAGMMLGYLDAGGDAQELDGRRAPRAVGQGRRRARLQIWRGRVRGFCGRVAARGGRGAWPPAPCGCTVRPTATTRWWPASAPRLASLVPRGAYNFSRGGCVPTAGFSHVRLLRHGPRRVGHHWQPTFDRRPDDARVLSADCCAAPCNSKTRCRTCARPNWPRPTPRCARSTERRQVEERLRLALESGRMGAWDWDIATGRVVWSPGLEAIHGIPPGSFPGTFEAYQRDIHPADGTRVIRTIWEAVETRRPYRIEYRLVWPDGSVHWVEARGKPLLNEAGKAVRATGVCMDITERKRSDEAMQFLADASRSLAALVDQESTMQKVARLAVPRYADWCAVHIVGGDGGPRQVAVAHLDAAKAQLVEELGRQPGPDADLLLVAARVVRTGHAELVEDIPTDFFAEAVRKNERLQPLRDLGLRSYMCVPLVARNRVLVVLTFVCAESGRRYGAADLAVAEDLGHRGRGDRERPALRRAARRLRGARTTSWRCWPTSCATRSRPCAAASICCRSTTARAKWSH